MTENPYSKRVRKLIAEWGEENKDTFEIISQVRYRGRNKKMEEVYIALISLVVGYLWGSWVPLFHDLSTKESFSSRTH